jgi:hypothetical protein
MWPLAWVLPLLVFCVSLGFALAVVARSRRPLPAHAVLWAVSLLMSASASLAYAAGAALGMSLLLFRVYYVCGAMWMAAWLGQGSLALVLGRRARAAAWALAAASAAGGVLLFAVPAVPGSLAHVAGTAGTGVIPTHGLGVAVVAVVALLNTYGLACVVGVAAVSAWRRLRAGGEAGAAGNALIALGALVNGAAGTMARLGAGAGFWATLLVGWCVIFAGFVVGSRREAVAAAAGRVR